VRRVQISPIPPLNTPTPLLRLPEQLAIIDVADVCVALLARALTSRPEVFGRKTVKKHHRSWIVVDDVKVRYIESGKGEVRALHNHYISFPRIYFLIRGFYWKEKRNNFATFLDYVETPS